MRTELVKLAWRLTLFEPSCVIRSWSLNDAAALQPHAENRKVWLNLRDVFPHPYRLDYAHAFLRHVLNEKPSTPFAIALHLESIGCVGLQVARDIIDKHLLFTLCDNLRAIPMSGRHRLMCQYQELTPLRCVQQAIRVRVNLHRMTGAFGRRSKDVT